MASLARPSEETRRAGVPVSPVRLETDARPGARLDAAHTLLSHGAVEHAKPLIDGALARARASLAAAGGTDAADRLALTSYVADVVVALAIEGELDATDAAIAVETLAATRGEPEAACAFDLLRHAVRSPALLEIPPLVAVEMQLRLLQQLGFITGASLWHRRTNGTLEALTTVGADQASRRVRATAKAAFGRLPSLTMVGRASLRTAQVKRFGDLEGVVVARIAAHAATARADEGLRVVTRALAPLLERELMLQRGAERERALVSAGEKRLMRLGFDLHDGPIQDVLSLAEEVRVLRDQVYPFVLESHRERAYARFDDLLARVSSLDGQLRELAQSLESKSIVSRPIGEVLHREVEAYAERTGIDARLEIRGDPESLTSAQRVAVFRAIQESLANVREHAEATAVEIRVRSRRTATNVSVTDNGIGFDVSRALVRAAQHGRLGVVGIGERVRMLGGTFSLDSQPGGPTTLSFTLPHWQTLEQNAPPL